MPEYRKLSLLNTTVADVWQNLIHMHAAHCTMKQGVDPVKHEDSLSGVRLIKVWACVPKGIQHDGACPEYQLGMAYHV